MGAPSRMSVAPGRYSTLGTMGNRGMYRAGLGPVGSGSRAVYRSGIASGSYGQWQGKGNWSGGGKHAYWHGGRHHHGGYWPWWGAGAGFALAAGWPYYGGYYDYGYDDCIQWRPDWGWVNVCSYPYGGYYPY
jgi:hypothetical protein